MSLWNGIAPRSALALIALSAVTASTSAATQTARVNAPRVDHHQHLASPVLTQLLNGVDGGGGRVEVPADVAELLRKRTESWNDAAKLAELYAPDAIFFEDRVVAGRAEVAKALASRFSAAFRLVPIGYSAAHGGATVVTRFVRGEDDIRGTLATLTLSLARQPEGGWQIVAEGVKIPGPVSYSEIDAAALIALLDAAQIERAVVLSIAYILASPHAPKRADEAAAVAAENDWTAAQVARYPDRLVGFCSVNPLSAYALEEMRRCAGTLKLRGLKLHFANSNVDLKKADHVSAVRAVFAEANRLRLAVVAHLWTLDPNYGAPESRIFLDQILPAAPDVTVQIAHMAGAGPGWTDPALEVFADAVARKDPRTRRLYFDLATAATGQSTENLALLARRIRQIGVERILYGSDGAFGGRSTPDVEWGTFRGMVPLTDAEFATISENVAPYLR